MIIVSKTDLENLKDKIPKDSLIIASSTYAGKNILGILSKYFANLIQKITNPNYNNYNFYIAHIFTIYYKDNNLWVGEMDKKNGWAEVPIQYSVAFRKLTSGYIRIFNLGKIEKEEFNNFLEHARPIKYPLIGAIASKKFFWCLKFLRSKRSFEEKRHCGEIFFRYKPFYKIFKIASKVFLRKYKTHHPEAIDHYLNKELEIVPIIIKINKKKICSYTK